MEPKKVKITLPNNCDVDKVDASIEDGFIVVEYTPKEKEKEVRTWDDLIGKDIPKNKVYIHYDGTFGKYKYPHPMSQYSRSDFIDVKHAKSAIAMAQISQLMPYYGEEITDEEWNDDRIEKYSICRKQNHVTFSTSYHYEFISFHTEEQLKKFYKYNEQLVKDYLMIE